MSARRYERASAPDSETTRQRTRSGVAVARPQARCALAKSLCPLSFYILRVAAKLPARSLSILSDARACSRTQMLGVGRVTVTAPPCGTRRSHCDATEWHKYVLWEMRKSTMSRRDHRGASDAR